MSTGCPPHTAADGRRSESSVGIAAQVELTAPGVQLHAGPVLSGEIRGRAVLAELFDDVIPVEHRLFTGVVTAATFGKIGALLFRAMGGRFGDFRDWDAIEKWSGSIADALADIEAASR